MTRISKPPQERKGENRSAALELFLRNGYENTSVGDIVEKVGVAQGLFYNYFRTKEEVYRAAMERYADQCAEELIAIMLEEEPLAARFEKALQYMENLIGAAEHAFMEPARLAEHPDMGNRFSPHVEQALICRMKCVRFSPVGTSFAREAKLGR